MNQIFTLKTARGYFKPASASGNEVHVEVEAGEAGEFALIVLESPLGEKVGVQCNSDGHFTFGTWDEDGTWQDLTPMFFNDFGQPYSDTLNRYHGEV